MYRGGYRGRGGFHRGRGGRNGGSTTTRLKGLFADGIWHCNCTPRLPAEHFKVKKEGKNQGRWFYTCQNKEPKRCDFFLWDEAAKPREEAAVLSNSRTEPLGRASDGGEVQEGWNAGRAPQQQRGKGLFANTGQRHIRGDNESTASPTPSYTSPTRIVPPNSSAKRTARDAGLDGEDDDFFSWPLTGHEEQELVKAADSATEPETPHKAKKTGVYATPATTGKRKLPWLEQPTTPATTSKTVADYFTSPSKRLGTTSPLTETHSNDSVETPRVQKTVATARTSSPPTRHKDALVNPADGGATLTAEALAALSTTDIPPDVISKLRSILSKHDLKTQGILKGRDISRLALKAKDAKIAELQAKIASLEADREVDKGVIRQLKWQNEHGEDAETEDEDDEL
jgi:hypothetical protein